MLKACVTATNAGTAWVLWANDANGSGVMAQEGGQMARTCFGACETSDAFTSGTIYQDESVSPFTHHECTESVAYTSVSHPVDSHAKIANDNGLDLSGMTLKIRTHRTFVEKYNYYQTDPYYSSTEIEENQLLMCVSGSFYDLTGEVEWATFERYYSTDPNDPDYFDTVTYNYQSYEAQYYGYIDEGYEINGGGPSCGDGSSVNSNPSIRSSNVTAASGLANTSYRTYRKPNINDYKS